MNYFDKCLSVTILDVPRLKLSYREACLVYLFAVKLILFVNKETTVGMAEREIGLRLQEKYMLSMTDQIERL